MSESLPEDLTRLSQRGPHADRSTVIADALAAAGADLGRTSRRGGAVAAIVVLVVGLGALAYVAADSTDTQDGLPAGATDNTPVSTVFIQPTACPEVSFNFDEAAVAVGLTTSSGTNDSVDSGFQLSDDLFMSRQGRYEPELDSVPNSEVEGWLDVTTQAGYTTTVYPAQLGSPGPVVAFVFPTDASADDPCRWWTIGSQDPNRPPADLVTLIEGLEMTATADSPSDPTALDLLDDAGSVVLAAGRYGGPLRDQGCDWTLVPLDDEPGVSVRTVRLGGQGSRNVYPGGIDDIVWVTLLVVCTDGPSVAVGGVSGDVTRVVVRSSDGEEFEPEIFDVPGQRWRAVMGEYPSTWLAYFGDGTEIIAYRDGEVLSSEPYQR